MDKIFIKKEITYGETPADPAWNEILPIKGVSNGANKIWGNNERVINLRFPCPSCAKIIASELRLPLDKRP